MSTRPDDTIEIETLDTERPALVAEEEEATSGNRSVRLTLYGGLALLGLGWLVLYLGYNGAATNALVVAQLPYVISGGFAGGSLVLLGGLMLLASLVFRFGAGLREDVAQLEEAVRALGDAVAEAGAEPASVNGYLVAARGSSSFHRPDCRLVANKKELRRLSPAQAGGVGLVACRVCKPSV